MDYNGPKAAMRSFISLTKNYFGQVMENIKSDPWDAIRQIPKLAVELTVANTVNGFKSIMLHGRKGAASKALQAAHYRYMKKKALNEEYTFDVFVKEVVQKNLGPCFHEKRFNLAVIGNTKAGKSSLINAIRGIRDYHDDQTDMQRKPGEPKCGSAAVGVAETTQHLDAYAFPGNPEVVIWDVPGAGTPGHPAEDYYDKKCLFAFDCLVLLIHETIREVDVKLLQRVQEDRIPVAIVRSRCDEAIKNLMRIPVRDSAGGPPRRRTAQEAAQEVRDATTANVKVALQAAGVRAYTDSIFFVSSVWMAYAMIDKCQGGDDDFVTGYPPNSNLAATGMDEQMLLLWLGGMRKASTNVVNVAEAGLSPLSVTAVTAIA